MGTPGGRLTWRQRLTDNRLDISRRAKTLFLAAALILLVLGWTGHPVAAGIAAGVAFVVLLPVAFTEERRRNQRRQRDR